MDEEARIYVKSFSYDFHSMFRVSTPCRWASHAPTNARDREIWCVKCVSETRWARWWFIQSRERTKQSRVVVEIVLKFMMTTFATVFYFTTRLPLILARKKYCHNFPESFSSFAQQKTTHENDRALHAVDMWCEFLVISVLFLWSLPCLTLLPPLTSINSFWDDKADDEMVTCSAHTHFD